MGKYRLMLGPSQVAVQSSEKRSPCPPPPRTAMEGMSGTDGSGAGLSIS
jgi:hypothetical protein